MIKLWIADGFQFLDPNRVILQLIVVSAELLRAAHIFMTTVLRFLQNRIELGNDLADFPLHAIDSCVENFSSTACRMTEVCSVSSFSICGMIDDCPLDVRLLI